MNRVLILFENQNNRTMGLKHIDVIQNKRTNLDFNITVCT